jgi:hypothetical protein
LEDELHAESAIIATPATAIRTTLDRSLIGPHLGGMVCTCWMRSEIPQCCSSKFRTGGVAGSAWWCCG